MKLAFEMEYRHPTGQRSSVELTPYSSEYQNQYREIYNACFHEMRKALNRKPYDFIQNDSFFATGMDKVFLLLKQGEIIGSVALKDDEIDDLIVNAKYQGRGYGRQLLLWALEHMHSEKIILHVAEWNQKAMRLYESVGFETVKTFEIL